MAKLIIPDVNEEKLVFLLSAQTTPFQIDVKFDDNEVLGDGAVIGSEQFAPTGGIVGFNLNFQQVRC